MKKIVDGSQNSSQNGSQNRDCIALFEQWLKMCHFPGDNVLWNCLDYSLGICLSYMSFISALPRNFGKISQANWCSARFKVNWCGYLKIYYPLSDTAMDVIMLKRYFFLFKVQTDIDKDDWIMPPDLYLISLDILITKP